MQLIPTLFVREDGKLTSKVDPDCQWVLDGQGTATRQYDGVCLLKDADRWWVRHVAAPGETWPEPFAKCQYLDDGTVIGWIPVDRSEYIEQLDDALSRYPADTQWPWETYELFGPDINGNPEEVPEHRLVFTFAPSDAVASVFDASVDAPRNFKGLRKWMATFDGKGVVWHHSDGRKAKVRRSDFEES